MLPGLIFAALPAPGPGGAPEGWLQWGELWAAGTGARRATSSFAGSSRKAEAPKSACETVGNTYQDGSKYSLGGETKAVFTEPGFQLVSRRGTHPGLGEKSWFPMHWDGGESGVHLCAGGIR